MMLADIFHGRRGQVCLKKWRPGPPALRCGTRPERAGRAPPPPTSHRRLRARSEHVVHSEGVGGSRPQAGPYRRESWDPSAT